MAKDLSNISRRTLLGATSAALVSPLVAAPRSATTLRRAEFAFEGVFLNAAYTHPLSKAVAARLEDVARARTSRVGQAWTDDNYRDAAVSEFAGLVNVPISSVAIVPSTMTGENMLLDALGIGPSAGVVTDALHYFGSLALYQQKAAIGVPVAVVRARDNAIMLRDVEAAIGPATRLISVSLVSGLNGFTHDLKALCDMAHSRGVLVYADIIQAAGAMPIDLVASGVDFACCGAHKWLMGDFGAAFLYVRPDRMSQLVRKAVGWRQVADHATHWLPYDAPGGDDEFAFAPGPLGLFEIGTPAHAALGALATSIADIRRVGVKELAARRRPLIDELQRSLPPLGLRCLSPVDNMSGISTFAFPDARRRIAPAFEREGIIAQVATNRIRFSPSSYNEPSDISRVIAAVRAALRS